MEVAQGQAVGDDGLAAPTNANAFPDGVRGGSLRSPQMDALLDLGGDVVAAQLDLSLH